MDGPVTIDLTLDDPSDSAEDIDEPEPISHEIVVYRNLIAAVLAVITFCLSSREGFTPLNCRTLVSPSSLPTTHEYKSQAERNGKEEILPSQPITVPELVTPLVLELEVYMTSGGTLVIIPHSEKQTAIRRIGTCGLTTTSLQHREVFIAPWGEWGRILPPSEGMDSSRAEDKWKENVISYLKDRGIISPTLIDDPKKSVLQEAVEQGKWLNVEIWLRSLTDPSTGELHRVLWPSALLFLRTSEGDQRTAVPLKDKEDPDFWKLVFEDQEYSQLAWGKLALLIPTLDRENALAKNGELDSGAEWWNVPSSVEWGLEWFKGREERARKIKEKIEERRKKELAEARYNEDRLTSETFDKGKGKLGPDTKSGPGGVYPTPPDAAVAALTGGPASTSSTGAMDISTAFSTGGANGMDHDWTGEPTTANDSTQPPIGRETDLFGDEMDDMDLLMKVTEDDFDFFDNNDGFDDGDGAGGSSGMDLDVGGVDMSGTNMGPDTADLRMETPPPISNLAPDVSAMIPARQPEARSKKRSRAPVPTDIKAVQAIPENQVRTPPLSPHRAMSLLVPGYSPPMTNVANFTPPASGPFKKPAKTIMAKTGCSPDATIAKRRMSMYSPITFTESVEMADQKYAPGGRFFLPPEDTKDSRRKEGDATKIDKSQILKRKRTGLMATSGPTAATPMDVITIEDDEEAIESASDWEDDDDTEESDADDTTEDDESRYHTSPDRTGAPRQLGFLGWAGRKRKWPIEGGEMEIDLPEGFPQRRDVAISAEGDVDIVRDIAPAPWKSMQPDLLDESLVGVFEDMTLTSDALSLGSLVVDAEFLDVAAVLAGQMAGWIHTSWSGKNETVGDDEEDEETCLIRRRCGRDQSLVEDAVKTLFKDGTVVRCSLETYASIADSIQEPAPLPPPPPLTHFGGGGLEPNLSQRRNKGPRQTSNKGWDIFHVPPPHVRLQRGDNVLEMLPPALYFWETFSLAPISGGKNVISFCFHPSSDALKEGADFLLDRVSSSYEAGRFGIHVRAEVESVVINGLVPVEIPEDAPRDYENGMKSLLSHLESFGSVIASGVADEGMNVVIYVVNPFQHPSALVDICTGFVRMQRLYETCIATLPEAKPNHLVLQIVPASFVAHKLGGVMRVGIVHRLAVEVYSRCIPTDAGIDYDEAKRVSSPPIQLARPIPKSIEFRITPDPSPALLKENQLLHIAYSQSLDERWVAVAWSDNTGALQKTAIINLGRQNTAILRPFPDVMNEIWDTTIELIKYPAVKWRLCITKVCNNAAMPHDERETWQALVKTHERVSATYLLCADLSSPYRVSETLPELKMENFWPQANLYSTPPVVMNTPTPTGSSSIVSPDATATTPGGGFSESVAELDADAELLDAVDESWGVVVGHTVPKDQGKRKRSPTGLLLRRDGGEEGGGWRVVVCFSVLEGGGVEVVREVVEVWRGLGVLGTFVGGRGGVPWMLAWCAGVGKIARVM
jgi:hypothetical protein